MSKPLAIDLYAGLGGWTEGLLAEGYRVIGFDIERHVYGEERYPAQLVLQDVCTLHGSQFKDATLIVASSPCQEFSYRAMPWKRAKALPPPHFGMHLFAQAARIQREASEAAGRHIPMVQENVRGAQPWVGRAQWNYGSFYLWGDVPALMPMTQRGASRFKTHPGEQWNVTRKNFTGPLGWKTEGEKHPDGAYVNNEGRKNSGGSWFYGAAATGGNPARGITVGEAGQNGIPRRTSGSGSSARKRASALIAKIPLPLSRYIAAHYREAR